MVKSCCLDKNILFISAGLSGLWGNQPGYRDRIEEIKEKEKNIREDADELRNLIWETIEEEGLAEKLTGE